MPAVDPVERRLHCERMAELSWAGRDPNDPNGAPAVARARSPQAPADSPYWLGKADPDGTLTEDERLRRAEKLRAAHMKEMTRRSLVARRKRKALLAGGGES